MRIPHEKLVQWHLTSAVGCRLHLTVEEVLGLRKVIRRTMSDTGRPRSLCGDGKTACTHVDCPQRNVFCHAAEQERRTHASHGGNERMASRRSTLPR